MRTLQEVAKRLLWWKSPEEAFSDPHRFLAQVMVFGTVEDILAAREHFPESAWRAVLLDPPTGLFDPRSWAYWHLVFHMEKPPEPPSRAAMLERLPDRPAWKHAG